MSDLTFCVKRGAPLIVTGPNGSGKSSLFRVLGGLWEIPDGGRVFRPCQSEEDAPSSSSGIQVFLVPQKPYHSNGSLADQITYPHHIPVEQRTVELEQKLLGLLELVEVQNLVERWSWHDARIVAHVTDAGPVCWRCCCLCLDSVECAGIGSLALPCFVVGEESCRGCLCLSLCVRKML